MKKISILSIIIIVYITSCIDKENYYFQKINKFETLLRKSFINSFKSIDSEIIKYNSSARDSLAIYKTVKSIYNSNDCEIASFVDANNFIRITQPDIFMKYIGSDVSNQSHVRFIRVNKQKIVSPRFKAVQGFDAIILCVPLIKKNIYDGYIGILLKSENIIKNIISQLNLRDDIKYLCFQKNGEVLGSNIDYYNNCNLNDLIFENDKTVNYILNDILGKNFNEFAINEVDKNINIKVFWKKIDIEQQTWYIALMSEYE